MLYLTTKFTKIFTKHTMSLWTLCMLCDFVFFLKFNIILKKMDCLKNTNGITTREEIASSLVRTEEATRWGAAKYDMKQKHTKLTR